MDVFKLLGTIAIDNKAANKALDDVSNKGKKTAKDIEDLGESGGKAEGKMSAAFQKMGHGAAVVGKTILTGLAAGGAAITALGTMAINSYADYEQLAGGAQLLFGEAWGYIEEKSKNAYQTVQMSQNEYLQQVNGFSTGLKTALGGNAQAAAELADRIVNAEADIIAATGNTAENVQNAFNGIMKSNFTMLDNLQLGITPTKEGFQDVIDKVNEWNAANGEATKYQIDNLADCQSALLDYIEMQGMSGYAAAEAAGTIQGSFAMLKGAWSNLMTGLADPNANIDQLIQNVFTSATTVAENLIPRITQVLSGVTAAIQQIVPLLASEIPKLLDQVLPSLIEGAVALIDGLVAAMPSIIQTILTALPMLIDGVLQLVEGLTAALPQMIEMIVAALPTLIPQIISAIVNMTVMIAAMLPEIIVPIIEALPMIITSIVEALLTNLPILIAGVWQLIVGLAGALPEIFTALFQSIGAIFSGIGNVLASWFEPVKTYFSDLWQSMGNVPGLAQLKTIIEAVWSACANYVTTYINAIKNIVTTTWNAIKNVISTVLNSVKNVITTAWNAIKTIISNVMNLISSLLKGDWEGVKNALSNILNAIKSVIASIWNGIKATISSVLNGIKSIVSSVWNGIKSVVMSVLNGIKSVVTTVWNTIKSVISSVLNGIRSTVTSIWNSIKSAISNAVNAVKSTVSSGFNNVKNTIVSILKSIPGKVASVGMDIVRGIGNGITNGVGWIKGKITSFVGDVTSFLKNLFGIASPSKLMRDEVGRYIAEGIGVGITENTSLVTDAAEKMAKDVLASAKNGLKKGQTEDDMYKAFVKGAKAKFEEQKTYNEMSVQDEVTFWDAMRKACKKGTAARVELDQKYWEARNSIDDKIIQSAEKKLDAHKTYNQMTLAEEVGFWDEVRAHFEEGTDARLSADKKYLDAKKSLDDQILKEEENLQNKLDEIQKKRVDGVNSILNDLGLVNDDANMEEMYFKMRAQTNAIEDYQKQMDNLASRIGSSAFYEAIESLGLDGHETVDKLNKMTDAQLSAYVDAYDKRTAAAERLNQRQIGAELNAETRQAFSNHLAALDSLGVEIKPDPIIKIGTSLPEYFKNFFDIIGIGEHPFAVEFVNNASMVAELAPATMTPLQKAQESWLSESTKQATKLGMIAALLDKHLPDMHKKLMQDVNISLDSGELVGTLAPMMNTELGKISMRKDRGR